MRASMLVIALLTVAQVLAQAPAFACDEECAAGFVFDDKLGTCVRVTTS